MPIPITSNRNKPIIYIHLSYPEEWSICKYFSLLHVLHFTVFFFSHFLFFLLPFLLLHTLASPPAAGSRCLPISHLLLPPFPSLRLAEEGWECQEGPTPALVSQPMSLQVYDKPVVFLPAVIVGIPASMIFLQQKQKQFFCSVFIAFIQLFTHGNTCKATLAMRSHSSSQPLSLFPIT